jgi:hypothetical protein
VQASLFWEANSEAKKPIGETDMTQFNSIAAYAEAGRKAGLARKHGDEACARFHSDWAKRALRLESGDYKAKAEAAFKSGYSEGAAR